jgi:hypothetical protein
VGPRRRRKANEKLPPYVYLKRGRYVQTTYCPETKKQTDRRLCSGDATLAEVWAAWEAQTKGPRDTFRWLSEKYLESVQFMELAKGTRHGYEGCHRRICNTDIQHHGKGKLGDLLLSMWTARLVQRYLDKRGLDAPVTANREKAYLSRLC